jgi:hypothetical protein
MKTPIEWIFEKLFEEREDGQLLYQLEEDIVGIFEKAKEMEKLQIFEAWDSGFDNGNYYGKYNETCEIVCGEKYYYQIFKK